MDDVLEALEESDFEATIESDDEDEDDWTELMIFESCLDGPITLFRYLDTRELNQEVKNLVAMLASHRESDGGRHLLGTFDNCIMCFGIEVPEEMAEDDNALLLCLVLAQLLSQRCDGIYCVDDEGFFDDSGDLILELASGE